MSSRNIVRFAVAVVFSKKTNLTLFSLLFLGNNVREGEAPAVAWNTAGLGWDVTINRGGRGALGINIVCWTPDIGILGGPPNGAVLYRSLTYVDTRGTWTTCEPVTFYLLRFTG